MERCFNSDEIPDLTRLPPDDPRRHHLAECPHCRNAAAAQALFLAPGDTSDLEDLAAVDRRLQERLDAVLVPALPATASRRKRQGWYALAAMLAVCALGLTATDLLRLRDGALPRVGERVRGEDQSTDLSVTNADGNFRFTWTGAPDAESYAFVWLGTDLKAIEATTLHEPRLTAAPADLPPAARFCQVYAVSQGDTIARSAIVRARPDRK